MTDPTPSTPYMFTSVMDIEQSLGGPGSDTYRMRPKANPERVAQSKPYKNCPKQTLKEWPKANPKGLAQSKP